MNSTSSLLNFLQQSQNYWLPLSIFTASLLGSWHCVAMCGGLVSSVSSNKKLWFSYQAGRLFSYLLLGSLAGLLGQSAVKNTIYGFLPWLVALTLGLGLIWMGVKSLPGAPHFSKLSLLYSTLFSKVWKMFSIQTLALGMRNILIGFLSGFLPCGWLYSFVLAALATQKVWTGALVLFFFWLGTLPALSLSGYFTHKIIRPLTQRVPKLSAIILILAGFLTLGLKMSSLTPLDSSTPASDSSLLESCPMHHR